MERAFWSIASVLLAALISGLLAACAWLAMYLIICFITWEWVEPFSDPSRAFFIIVWVIGLFGMLARND